MAVPQVGVLTDDPTLVVALGLRAHDMDVRQVDSAGELAGHDLALVDLAVVDELEAALSQLGHVPTVVLVSEPVVVPAGVAVVGRPCSVEQVVSALQAARDGEVTRDETIVLDRPVTPAPPLFTSTPAARPTGWSSQDPKPRRRRRPPS